jgi:2-C-methyl-D-erythritol 4-phosphate cytidylyltransferase
MTHPNAQVSSGQVAAFVVATWPDGGALASDLLWRSVLGRPLVAWPLRALAQLENLSSCALVVPPVRYADGAKMVNAQSPSLDCRVIAVDAVPWSYTLDAVVSSSHVREEWIILVDATLPLVTTASLRAGLEAARRTGVAIAGEPVKETLKRVDGSVVAETLPRERLRRLLSPLIFSQDALRGIYKTLRDHPSTSADLVGLAQLAGVPLTVFAVDYPAVRVTSEHDLAIVESLLRQRESESSSL